MSDMEQNQMAPSKPMVDRAFSLIGQSWKIFSQKWKKLFWFLLFFPIIIMLVSLLVGVAGGSLAYVASATGMAIGLKIFLDILFAVLIVLGVVIMIYFGIVINIAAVYVVAEDLSVKEAFKKARPIFWKFFGWAILLGIIIFVGFIVFIVPGIILLVMLSFSIFALTLEGLEPFAAFKRSAQLVKGFWWTIFARFVVLGIVVIILSIISNTITDAGGVLFGYVDKGWGIMIISVIIGIILFLLAFVINFVVSSISLIFNYLLYTRLKEIKEKDASAVDKMSVGKKVALAILIAVIFAVVIIGSVALMIFGIALAG